MAPPNDCLNERIVSSMTKCDQICKDSPVQLVTKFDCGGNTFTQNVPFAVTKEFPVLMDQFLQGKNPIVTDLSIPREALVDIVELGSVLLSKHKRSKRHRKDWLEMEACTVGSDTFADLVLIASTLRYPFRKEMKSALRECLSYEEYQAEKKELLAGDLPDATGPAPFGLKVDQDFKDLFRAVELPKDFRSKMFY